MVNDAVRLFRAHLERSRNAAEGRISITSPVARALLGKAVGDSVTVRVPKGTREFEILEIRID